MTTNLKYSDQCVLAAMPGTRMSLEVESGYSSPVISRSVRKLRSLNLAHISAYSEDHNSGRILAIFSAGSGADAVKSNGTVGA